MSFTGMGMPPINYLSQSGPEQHGETLLDFRLQTRIIQYSLYDATACSRQGYWDQRSVWIDALRPNRQAVDSFKMGRLRKVLPNGAIRDIDALIQEGPPFTARDPGRWMEWSLAETLRFKCPDPTWYDPVTRCVTWTVDVFNGLLFYHVTEAPVNLIFPSSAIFSSGVLSSTTTVTYTGTWFAYPVITLVGPLSGPTIYNDTLGVMIKLNYNISVGETVTINTAYGNKTITNQNGVNLIGTKTVDSNLNLYLAPPPIAAGGVNTLRVVGSGADDAVTSINLAYHTRYIGI
jgi:hypothetical protein